MAISSTTNTELCHSIALIQTVERLGAEKELPDAFLRRCIFHYIDFPDAEQMEQIIRVHLGDVESTLLAQSLQAFYWLRGLPLVEKKPSTSEIIDWIQALELGGIPTERITDEMPFLGTLLKKDKDLNTAKAAMRQGGSGTGRSQTPSRRVPI